VKSKIVEEIAHHPMEAPASVISCSKTLRILRDLGLTIMMSNTPKVRLSQKISISCNLKDISTEHLQATPKLEMAKISSS